MTESNSSAEDQQKVSDDDWAAAMSEQANAKPGDDDAEAGQADSGTAPDKKARGDTETRQADDGTAPDKNARSNSNAARATGAEDRVFKPLTADGDGDESAPRELDMIMDIPVTLSVELGQTRLTIRELLDLAKGSIVELDGLAGEPMDILINGYLIAQGEVVVVEDKYGIRITEIVTRSERINKLSR